MKNISSGNEERQTKDLLPHASPSTKEQLKQLAGYYRDVIAAFVHKGGRHFHDLRNVRSGAILADLLPFLQSWQDILDAEEIRITLPAVSQEQVTQVVALSTEQELAETSSSDDTKRQERREEDVSGKSEEDAKSQSYSEAEERELKERSAERLLAMYRKQEQDPYNRETIIGFPIVTGTYGSIRYCAPMFYFKVRLEYDPVQRTISMRKEVQAPDFNIHVLTDLAGEEGVVEAVRKHVLPRLHSGEFNANTVTEVVRVLADMLPAFRGLKQDSRERIALAEAMAVSVPMPLMLNACLAINAPKSHTDLLDDLTELAKGDPVGEDTAADAFLADIASDIGQIGDPDSAEYPGPLLFPLESNPAQQIVARKAERSKLMVVEGPPGTGKSQTIANLVCHLVAQGHTVLVASHQNKALEVVMEKLPPLEEDPERDYLAMAMLKGDAESARQLANKLKHFDATLGSGSRAQLEASLQDSLRHIQENLEVARRLRARFSELKNIEREAASNESVYYRFHEIRDYDGLHANDTIPEEAQHTVAEALGRWAELVSGLRPQWNAMRGLLVGYLTKDASLIAKRATLLDELVGMCNAAQALRGEPLAGEVLEVAGVDDPAAMRAALAEICEWLRKNRNRLLNLVAEVSATGLQTWGICEANILGRQLGATSDELAATALQVEEQARGLFVQPSTGPERVPTDDMVRQVEHAISRVEGSAGSWLRWYLSGSCRRCRRWLERAGFGSLVYGNCTEEIARIGRWVRHWQTKFDVIRFLQRSHGLGLLVEQIGPDSEPITVLTQAARVRSCLELAGLFSQMPHPSLTPEGMTALQRLIERIADARSFDKAITVAQHSVEHLNRVLRLDEIRGEPAMNLLWASSLKHWGDLVTRLADDQDVERSVAEVRELIPFTEAFVAVAILEQGPLASLARSLDACRPQVLAGDLPPWLQRPDLVLEAHRLRVQIQFELGINPDDISEVARKLRKLGEEKRRLVVDALRRRRRLALWEAAHDNRTKAQVDRLRRLLGKRRKTPSLVELREQIDYSAVLKVLPCWVMGIEDVARVFPLRPGTFDYVIVDEASQCSQATALHLAYRGRRMVVVGDEKQLQNPWVRFLPEDLVHLLLTKHQLHNHSNVDVLHARVSLLGLATRCSNSQQFLDEHFRSEPPIIAWSNKHFYSNRLKILTPMWPRRFSPCMELRLVRGADDDPDGSRTNELEAKAVIYEVRQLLENPEHEGLSIGVISPFRQQADLLQHLIYKEFVDHPEWIRSRRLVASTADGFQGDERDIILYSMRYGPSSRPGSIHAIELEKERLNVAFTRARRRVICFVSVPADSFPQSGGTEDGSGWGPDPSIRGYLEHALREYRSPAGRRGTEGKDKPFDSNFERDVCTGLRSRALRVFNQVPCAGFLIDLVVIDDEGRRMAVECDGEFHYDDLGDLRPDDYHRQEIIERAGWYVHRVSFRRFYQNPLAAFDNMVSALQVQDTESVRIDRDLGVPSGVAPAPDTDEAAVPRAESEEPAASTINGTEPSVASKSHISEERPIQGAPTTAGRDQLRSFEEPQKEGFVIGEGAISVASHWFALSHWGKETGLLRSFDRGFAFNIGRCLANKWALSSKQVSHAQRVWEEALKKGFRPPA